MPDVNLPAVVGSTGVTLQQITDALGVPRNVLAADEEIEAAWTGLPRILRSIPAEYGSPLLARMCVAVATGLFDSAINYVWNTSIIALRAKVRGFGLHVVSEIKQQPFDEAKLNDLKDAELLSLSLSLNLVSEEGYYLLDQCRALRNNFSAAHPPMGVLDDHEFLNFANRCARFALAETRNPTGIQTAQFIGAIKAGRFSADQLNLWIERLRNTHDAQRELLFGTLHGIYCDPNSSEEARRNAVALVKDFAGELTAKVKSALLDQHASYLAKGDTPRISASRRFFQELGLLGALGEAERHSIITTASKKMLDVHQALDNFYNEPPFAERLLEISRQTGIPETAKIEYVEAVITCAVGNPYGISNAAVPKYFEMIKNFSPGEIMIMLQAPDTNSIVGHRIRGTPQCRERYRRLLDLIDPASVPTQVRPVYDHWRRQDAAA